MDRLTSTKRGHDEENVALLTNKRQKLDQSDDLNNFNGWMSENGFKLNKVSVTKKNICSGWGMIANCDIKSKEIIFTVPREACLTPENSDLKEVIEKEKDKLKSKSGWIPLLVTLMYEYTKEHSKWRPYFNMVPDFQHFDMPMFWDENEINTELMGTSLKELIVKDLSSLAEEYHSIVVPFVRKHHTLFNLSQINLELFKKMVAFVMAYSFTEPQPEDDSDDEEEEHDSPLNLPMMVPLADILNHVSRNNAHLEFKQDSLNMVATRNIRQGEEVFNTYGELSNGQLLHMYGYAEEPSLAAFDTVDASAADLYKILLNEDVSDEALLERKWNYLHKTGYIPGDGFFVLGQEGVLTEEQLLEVFKIMQMNETEFACVEDKDEWLSDDEDDNGSLAIENISKLDPKIKKIFHKWIQVLIGKYPNSLNDEVTFIRYASELSDQSLRFRRKLYSAYVRCGQLQILEKFKECKI